MTTQPATPVGFVQHMEVKRQALGLGHGAWAGLLGIDRSLWYLLRQGQKELSIALIQRVMREWPDEFEPYLRDAVLAWRDRGPDGPDGGESLQEAC
jgi:hypothetical protein